MSNDLLDSSVVSRIIQVALENERRRRRIVAGVPVGLAHPFYHLLCDNCRQSFVLKNHRHCGVTAQFSITRLQAIRLITLAVVWLCVTARFRITQLQAIRRFVMMAVVCILVTQRFRIILFQEIRLDMAVVCISVMA